MVETTLNEIKTKKVNGISFWLQKPHFTTTEKIVGSV
jgi:hypothetical protein